MTGEYVGQTKKKVTDKLQEAKGSILFIDEAYELGRGSYGNEAMTTLLAAMTDPEYKAIISSFREKDFMESNDF
jgi:SpoVK/Ycf46/Vps4 family AAA+-type ATPase